MNNYMCLLVQNLSFIAQIISFLHTTQRSAEQLLNNQE